MADLLPLRGALTNLSLSNLLISPCATDTSTPRRLEKEETTTRVVSLQAISALRHRHVDCVYVRVCVHIDIYTHIIIMHMLVYGTMAGFPKTKACKLGGCGLGGLQSF